MKDKLEKIVSKIESGHLEPKEAVDELLVLFDVSKRALLTESQAKISCKLCNGKGHLYMKMEDGLYHIIDCPKCIAEI